MVDKTHLEAFQFQEVHLPYLRLHLLQLSKMRPRDFLIALYGLLLLLVFQIHPFVHKKRPYGPVDSSAALVYTFQKPERVQPKWTTEKNT